MWSLPVPHPSSVPPDKIENHDEDYHNLVNSVQGHTRCSSAYCLRNKTGHQEPKCRFDYPRPEQLLSTLTFEKIDNDNICATLTTKRDDPRINSHNRVQLQHW